MLFYFFLPNLLKFTVQDNITGIPDKIFFFFFLNKIGQLYFYLVILPFLHIFDIHIAIFTDR